MDVQGSNEDIRFVIICFPKMELFILSLYPLFSIILGRYPSKLTGIASIYSFLTATSESIDLQSSNPTVHVKGRKEVSRTWAQSTESQSCRSPHVGHHFAVDPYLS